MRDALAHRDYTINGSEVHIDIYDDRMELYSPGGMPDGSFIQDRDPLTIPSTRRNPVLADVLNRLGYMERKGSGFEKILSGYEFQINYDESKKPRFRSDRYQFTVVMPNLNYEANAESDEHANVRKDDTNVRKNVRKDDTNVRKNALDDEIISLIRHDNKITTQRMAIVLNVAPKTIQRHIRSMEKVKHIGSRRGGYWEIKE